MGAETEPIDVLLIEDDEVDARGVQKMLGEFPDVRTNLTHADCLTAGIEWLKNQGGVHVVLLDLGLSESRGLATLDNFCNQVADVPIVVLTSADDRQLGVAAVQHGAQDYLVKGKVDADLMNRTISYAIERHRMQLDMQRLLGKLEHSNRELEQFAFIVAHDLKAPLRTVRSFCQLLEKDCRGKLDKQAEQHLENILTGAARMGKIIDDLLEYSRVKKEDKPAEPTDFEAVYDQAVADLQAAIDESGATVTQHGLPVLPANQSQMVQLFENLIGNAIKFRGPEPPKVHVAAEQQDYHWLFSVQDNGIGIEREHWKKVFDVFGRLHAEDKYNGTGIGLAICKRIVQHHAGHIWVASIPGKGSSFYFTIPVKSGER